VNRWRLIERGASLTEDAGYSRSLVQMVLTTSAVDRGCDRKDKDFVTRLNIFISFGGGASVEGHGGFKNELTSTHVCLERGGVSRFHDYYSHTALIQITMD